MSDRADSSSASATPPAARAALIANQRATGRLQDLADLEALGEG
jgi:hypothetical protein